MSEVLGSHLSCSYKLMALRHERGTGKRAKCKCHLQQKLLLQTAQGEQLPPFSCDCFAFSPAMALWKCSCCYVPAANSELADVPRPRKVLGFPGSYCAGFFPPSWHGVNKATGCWVRKRAAFLFAVFTGTRFTCGSVFN